MSQIQRIWDLMNTGFSANARVVTQHTGFGYGSVSAVMSLFNKAGLFDVTAVVGKGNARQYQVKLEFRGKEFSEVKDKIYAIKRGYEEKWRARKRAKIQAKQRYREKIMERNETLSMVKATNHDIENIELVNHFKDAIGEVPRKIQKSKIRSCFEEALNTF